MIFSFFAIMMIFLWPVIHRRQDLECSLHYLEQQLSQFYREGALALIEGYESFIYHALKTAVQDGRSPLAGGRLMEDVLRSSIRRESLRQDLWQQARIKGVGLLILSSALRLYCGGGALPLGFLDGLLGIVMAFWVFISLASLQGLLGHNWYFQGGIGEDFMKAALSLQDSGRFPVLAQLRDDERRSGYSHHEKKLVALQQLAQKGGDEEQWRLERLKGGMGAWELLFGIPVSGLLIFVPFSRYFSQVF